jgi:hypothetical protein
VLYPAGRPSWLPTPPVTAGRPKKLRGSQFFCRRGVQPADRPTASRTLRRAGVRVFQREGYGTGLTVNVGHRAGKAAVAVFLGVVLVLPSVLVTVVVVFVGDRGT